MVLEGAIGRGAAGEQAIAEAADILDDPTRARLREKLDARRAEDAARDRRIEKVSAVLAGRVPATGAGEGDGKPDGGGEDLRPGAPGWRQAVDDHYARLAPDLETMDPGERARFEDDYTHAVGVLPGPVLKQVRAGLLSSDPAAQAAAAQRLARLKDVDPALVSAIPANERRRAQAIAEFVDLGLTPERAVELAEEKRAGVGEDDQPAGGGLPLGRDTLLRPAAKDDDLIGRIAALSNDVLNLALGEPDGRERGEKAARPDVTDTGGSPLSGPGGTVKKIKKPTKPRPPAVGNAGPPTNNPVVLHDIYKKLGFDPNGKGQYEEFLQTPIDGIRAALIADEAVKTVDKQIRKGRFTKASRNGGDADAFRHAYWNYRMTEELGPDAAKRFGDAREITAPGPDGDRLMDLFNNNVGRRLALDPANKGRPAEDVILDAMKKGQLQAQPFKILFKPAPGIPSRKKSP